MTKNKSSKCEKIKKKNLKGDKTQKLKIGHNSKPQNVGKKNSKCDKTQK